MKGLCLTLIVVCVAFASLCQAQIDPGNATFKDISADTTDVDPVQVADRGKQGLLSVFYGHPGRAAFYGLIIPGGGQAYNRKYWKVPLAVGLEALAIFNFVQSNQEYRAFQRALIDINEGEIVEFRGFTTAAQIRAERDAFRRRREYGILYMAGAHIFTFMEAYIDRHLTDFDVSDDLTLGLNVSQSTGSLAFGAFYSLR